MRRSVAAVQGAFYLATGLWPLVHMPSFLAVTGPKTDLWLVNTVGLLVLVPGVVFLASAWRATVSREIVLLAVSEALCLTAIDVTYVAGGRISQIYLLDAVAEVLLVCGWIVALLIERRTSRPAS